MSLCRDIDCGMALTMASCLRRLLDSEGVENRKFPERDQRDRYEPARARVAGGDLLLGREGR